MGEGGREEEKGSSALSLFRFHLSPFPQKRLILRLTQTFLGVRHAFLPTRHEPLRYDDYVV